MQMDVLVLEGKNYVKSSVIARELGYTSDYVGQLCRSGKVEAKLFGKTWYVEKSSISGHKQTRYRSSKAVTKRVLHAEQETGKATKIAIHDGGLQADTPTRTHVTEKNHFYTHTKRENRVATRYSDDTTGLIPEPSKFHVRKHLQVELADAEMIGITSQKDEYNFEVPTLPEIRFKGKLVVSAIEDGGIETIDTVVGVRTQILEGQKRGAPIHIHPKDVSRFATKKAKNKVISSILQTKKNEQHLAVSQYRGDRSEVIAISKAVSEPITSAKSYFVLSSFALTLSLLLSIMCIILDAEITVTTSTVTTDYQVRFQNLSDVFFILKNIL